MHVSVLMLLSTRLGRLSGHHAEHCTLSHITHKLSAIHQEMYTRRLAGIHSGNHCSGWESASDLDELPARQLRGALDRDLHTKFGWQPGARVHNSCSD